MKSFLLSLIIVLSFNGCEQSVKQTDSKEKKHKDGIEKLYYDDGSLRYEVKWINGKQEEYARSYYKSGKLKVEAPFNEGKLEGLIKEFYEDGTLKLEKFFKNNRAEGLSKKYYKNGQLALIENWENSRAIGVWKYYYQDGKIWFIATYKDYGRVKGILYDKDGNSKEVKNIYLFNEVDRIFASYDRPN